MKKKIFIIFIISLILINFLFISNNISYASVKDDLGNLNLYKGGKVDNSNKLVEKAGVILGALQVIGTAVSVIALMVIGIKYMLGSAEQKANYKQTLMPYIIGAVIVFSTTALPNIIYQLVK